MMNDERGLLEHFDRAPHEGVRGTAKRAPTIEGDEGSLCGCRGNCFSRDEAQWFILDEATVEGDERYHGNRFSRDEA